MAGRSNTFKPEIGAQICGLIASGKSLRKILKSVGMPLERTVYNWLRDIPEFAGQYAQAREAQADTYADAIVEIADTEKDAAKARNRIDARKWAAGKLRPKVYGDKVSLDHSGSIQTVPDEQLDARLAILLGKAGASGAS